MGDAAGNVERMCDVRRKSMSDKAWWGNGGGRGEASGDNEGRERLPATGGQRVVRRKVRQERSCGMRSGGLQRA